ncbi:MAG TPA: hypothetical protein VFW96_23435 [Thermomicrobiales bacterium]|nr:hypothetical protein [Thermomicrobiales bacterium]
MSTTLHAVLGHRLSPADIPALPRALRADAAPELAGAVRALDAALSARPAEEYEDQGWHLSTRRGGRAGVIDPEAVWAAGEAILAKHPAGGVFVWIGHRSCIFGCGLVWSAFIESPHLQALVHDTCAALAPILGSPASIYLPSDYAVSSATNLVYEGGGLAEVAAWLREHHGPPVPSLGALGPPTDGRAWEGNDYFIDTFAPPEDRAP